MRSGRRIGTPVNVYELEEQLQQMNERMEQLENQLGATQDALGATQDELDASMDEVGYYRIRSPLKPVTLGELAQLADPAA